MPNREAHEISKKEKNNPKYLDKNYIDEWNKKNVEKFKNDIVLFCGSLKNNHILMWSHYANQHKGFCIGFNYRILGNLIGTDGKKVDYEDFPKISPNSYWADQIDKRIFTKSKHWEYEQEVRWYQRATEGDTWKVPFYYTEVVQEIILGCFISTSHREEIIETVKEKYSYLKVISQAKLKNDQFELDIEEIKI